MKTPIQEVFEHLRASKHKDSFGEAYCVDWLLAFESEFIEKEKQLVHSCRNEFFANLLAERYGCSIISHNIKQLILFNEALSDSELQQLTSKDENTKHKYSFGEAYCLVKQRKMKFERNGHTYKTHDSALTEWNSGGIENVPTHWLDVFKQNIDKELENRNLNTKEKKK